ncbi:MAG: hypothetical protein GEV08_18720 [Acidimicrobiia bacterium]|nr:hypothetical protein [Acidimicrobiia bacterium]
MIALVVVAVFFVGLWFSGERVEAGWLRFYSGAVMLAGFVLAGYDRWLWRWKPLQRLRIVPPDLHGTWKGTLASAWINPATGQGIPPKTAYLVVRQRALSVTVTMLTDESRSNSTLGRVSRIDGSCRLDYLYLNRPDLRVEHRSRMHHGSTVLDAAGTPAERLHGRYWTDRDSKGELSFAERRPAYADDFTAAEELFSSANTP